MPRRLLIAATTLTAAFAAAPAAASAESWFGPHDRVIGSAPRAGVAARRIGTPYKTKDGYTVYVSLSSAYTGNTALARRYVNFLDSLPHGSELGHLNVHIANSSQVANDCGGGPGVVACYRSADRQMIVPGSQDTFSDGTTTNFLVAHEYGHHISEYRSNDPFSSFTWGPKRWASYKLVCNGVENGRYFPGDEGDQYSQNPAEAWAETYAHMAFPQLHPDWQWDPALAPTTGSLAAARKDVLSPWPGYRHTTFTGKLSRSRTSKVLYFNLHLDGRLRLTLSGPKGSNYNLRMAAQGALFTTNKKGSSDSIALHEACRAHATTRVKVRVVRKSGSGTFRLRVGYAG